MKWMLAGAVTGTLTSCAGGSQPGRNGRGRVIVLAFDGMDPRLVTALMAAGRMPNFAKLAAMGSFTTIATSDPPQTPVAFSNIISGADASTHQVFDFIHRDANPAGGMALRPYFSTSDVALAERERAITMGKWRMPLTGGGEAQLLRRGDAFWSPLVKTGHDASIFYLPSNYPPQPASGPGKLRCMSGMGTPDINGGYGQFTLFSPDAPWRGKKVRGGRFTPLRLLDHRGRGEIIGPPNHMQKPDKRGRIDEMKVPFDVVRDPKHDVVKIEIGQHTVLLKAGEWSEWLDIDFQTLMPGSTVLEPIGAPTSVPAMVRLYVKQIHPKFELYVSPINVDPARPINTISVPSELSGQLAREHGRFYTLGIPEDTNALQTEALTADEFLSQVHEAHHERVDQYHHSMQHFDRGCLFFYFGTTDLVSHMFWRDRDPGHPGRKPAEAGRYASVIDDLYVEMDDLVGDTLGRLRDEDTLIVLSDHGFTSFRRSVNLNTCLLELGYLVLKPNRKASDEGGFINVDWTRSRAYAMGLNSVYINVKGREKNGIVASGREQVQLAEQVAQSLLELRDTDGRKPIASARPVVDLFDGADAQVAPDLIIGYADGFRVGWSAALGGLPAEMFEDNLERWSGDHCVASSLVPGIVLTNRPMIGKTAALTDVAPSILHLFGLSPTPQMDGRPVLERNS